MTTSGGFTQHPRPIVSTAFLSIFTSLDHGRNFHTLLSLRLSITLTNIAANAGTFLHLLRSILFLRLDPF